MSLQGPLIVVCDDPISALTERLTAAGASPVVEARRHEFATKLAAVRPAALTIAVGGRMGLIGALSLETAMSFLNSRDVDGIVIGDGFGRRMVEGFLVDLGADARFRDLPIAVLDHVIDEIDAERLPNLDRV